VEKRAENETDINDKHGSFLAMLHWKEKLKVRLPAMVLLGVTLLFWSFYDRFEPVDSALLEAPTLADATRSSGDVSEVDGVFFLNVPQGGKRAEVRFRLPASTNYAYIRVRARMKTDQVVEGKYGWHCARFIFVQYDENGKWMPGVHGLMSESGTMKRAYREQVFEMFPDAAYGEVAIQQAGFSGSAEFDDIEVQPVQLWAAYGIWRMVFVLLWLGMVILYFPRCRLNRRRLKLLILINVVAILCGTLMPSLWIQDSAEWFKDSVKQKMEKAKDSETVPSGQSQVKPPGTAEKKNQEISRMDQFNEVVGEAHQVGHFVLFASLCFLVYWSAALEQQHRSYYFKVAFDILLFAGITESLQLLTLDRTAGIHDLLVDLYGMLSALLVFILLKELVGIGGRFKKHRNP
jgi:hypothetical protein